MARMDDPREATRRMLAESLAVLVEHGPAAGLRVVRFDESGAMGSGFNGCHVELYVTDARALQLLAMAIKSERATRLLQEADADHDHD